MTELNDGEYLLAGLENNVILGWKMPTKEIKEYKLCIRSAITKPSKLTRINDIKEIKR